MRKLFTLMLLSVAVITFGGCQTTQQLTIDVSTLEYEVDGIETVDTREVADPKYVGNLYTKTRNKYNKPGECGGGLTHNPLNKDDLWFVTASHCLHRLTVDGLRETFVMIGPQDLIKSDPYLFNYRNDIAIVNVRDDLLLEPASMDPNYVGMVRVRASTPAFDPGNGTALRVVTLTGECNFWRDTKYDLDKPYTVSTDCPSTQGSSGSPMEGMKNGKPVIVGVLSNHETREAVPEMNIFEQRRTLFRLVDLG